MGLKVIRLTYVCRTTYLWPLMFWQMERLTGPAAGDGDLINPGHGGCSLGDGFGATKPATAATEKAIGPTVQPRAGDGWCFIKGANGGYLGLQFSG